MPAITDASTTTRPVLCGTDFSDTAAEAAKAARAIANRMGAPLLLVHSLDERGEIPNDLRGRLRGPAERALARAADQLRESGVQIETKLLEGVPHDGIFACADKRQARMIVLAASGTGALGRWVLGSVAERVAESAAVPTLVVRDSAPFEQWARDERPLKVLAGIDFSPVSDAALVCLAELRQVGRCEIELVFVDRPPNQRTELAVFDALGLIDETKQVRSSHEYDLREKARRFLGDAPLKVHVRPGSARIDAHLLELASASRADVIVLGVHQHHGVARIWHSSISRRVLHDAQHNVLCVPVPKTDLAAGHSPLLIRRVLVATDFSDTGNRALAFACALLPGGGSLCGLHVVGEMKDADGVREQLRTALSASDARIDIELRVEVHAHPATAICEAANRFNADVICIGSHGRSALGRLVLGSVVQGVLAQSPRPVLVVTRHAA